MNAIHKIIKRMEWLTYEVDPEWSRFCSFGPEDIGGPWEKLGVIRKKPIFDGLCLDAIGRQAVYAAVAKEGIFPMSPMSQMLDRETMAALAWPVDGIRFSDSPAGNFLV